MTHDDLTTTGDRSTAHDHVLRAQSLLAMLQKALFHGPDGALSEEQLRGHATLVLGTAEHLLEEALARL